MVDEGGPAVLWIVLGVVLICGTGLWLWELARQSFQGRVIIVALWLVLLAMSMIAGAPWVYVMGAATVMMGLWIYMQTWG